MGGVGQLVGDPLSKIWTPYIGIRGQGRKCCGCDTYLLYKWRIIGSPVIWNKFTNPMDIHCQSPINTEIHRTLYTLQANSGGFLEGDFEGTVQVAPYLRGNVWLTGSWMEVNGTGNLTSTVIASTIFNVQPGAQDIENSKLHRSFFALGLGLELSL